MASSKKRPKNNLAKSKKTLLLSDLKLFLRDLFLQQKRIEPTLLIAYSGGLDSTVLLHALFQLQKEFPMRLQAMHIHHGLSENADEWAAFCAQVCTSLEIPLNTYKAHIDQDSGQGVEAAARVVRYQALFSEEADYICLAHHQDDQAETLLLQLARGAGVKGLAGMGQVDAKRRLIRPLLNVSRAALTHYAKQHKLQWVEDESNAEIKFDRNFIRHEVMPVLKQQYPSFGQTLARAASHMAQADKMLDDLALLDAKAVLDPAHQYGALRLNALQALDEARQVNLIRWWLAANEVMMPSTAILTQILKQLASKRTDTAIKVKVADRLYIMRHKAKVFLVEGTEGMPPIDLLWQGEEIVELPNLSHLFFTKKIGEGVAYERIASKAELRIRNRVGGERFKRELNRPRCSLKTMMQSVDMPPWQREQLPLIFTGETLAAIPNVGVDANLKAESQELGLVITWSPARS